MSTDRPDPDALLRRLNAEASPKRGRLKVFFGASPGVGKTFAMLESARAKRRDGVTVLIGWIETHGRTETAALLEGLEVLPARRVEYRGVVLEEFDLDNALARKPDLLVVDELPHTNAPGSRHTRRWQDVAEIVEAGIDVYTTLNVQHLESLNDLVNRVTGVAVRETVPDSVLDGANEIEFIDLPPEALLERLAEGKVYVPDAASRATRHFFRRGNLLALRELALRRTAEHVDADVQTYRRDHEIQPTWPVAERILVCIRPNPESDRLVRTARRSAARLRADWIVAYVESPEQPPLSAAERGDLARTVRLAEELGAETITLNGPTVSEAVLAFAQKRNVSRILVGKPVHSHWRDRLRGSLLEQIVRGSGDIEVLVIPGGSPRSPGDAPERRRPPRPGLWPFFFSLGVVALCTAVCAAMLGTFDNSNLIMVYLLGVAVVASFYGRRPSALAALLSVAAFDFFFVPPHLTFAVTDTQYVVTFAVMLLVSVLISTLAARVRAQAQAAGRREERTQTLYRMSREVATARTEGEVSAALCRHVTGAVLGPAEVFLPGPNGGLVSPSTDGPLDQNERAVARWAYEHRSRAGLGTETLPGSSALYVPLVGAHAPVGVVGVRPAEELLPLAPDQLDLVEALAHQAASGYERVHNAEAAEQARVAAESERLRNTLLSSVSHDLRTPLATITGAASTLLDPGGLDETGQLELKEAIFDEAQRLNRFVGNLLDMTRLEAGPVALEREWQSLEELVGAALARLDRVLRGHTVTVALPEDLPLVRLDGVLFEQALVNVLDNAVKYTAPGTTISITARVEAATVSVEVADAGPGLPSGTEERVFEKFFRGGTGPAGSGLGLPICRAILAAHGGTARAENRPGGGALFRLVLPLEPPPPPAREDDREQRDA